MKWRCCIGMRIGKLCVINREIVFLISMFLFLGCLFARDIFGTYISSSVFNMILLGGMIFFSRKDMVAFGCSLPLFFGGVETANICMIWVIIYFIRFKLLKHTPTKLFPFMVVAYFSIFEFVVDGKVVDSLSSLFARCVYLILFSLIMENIDFMNDDDVAYILRTFLIFYFSVMVEILFNTIRIAGTEFLFNKIRFGNMIWLMEYSSGSLMETSIAVLGNNQNYIALFCSVAVSVITVFIIRERGRVLFWVSLLGALVFGFLTASKTFFFISVIQLFFLIYIQWRKKKSVTQAGNSLVIVGVIMLLLYTLRKKIYQYVISNVWERLLIGMQTNDLSTGRAENSSEYIEYILQHLEYLFQGIGVVDITSKSGVSMTAHNMILDIIVSTGVLGLILWFSMIVYFVKNIRAVKGKVGVNGIALVTYLMFIQSIQFISIPEIYMTMMIVLFSLRYEHCLTWKKRRIGLI